MKARERVHRLFAGILAVVILLTSISLDSFAQNGEVKSSGTGEVIEAQAQDFTEDGSTDQVIIQNESGEIVNLEEPSVPEEPETSETSSVPEISETPTVPEVPEISETPTMSEQPESHQLEGRVYVDFDEDGEQDEDEEGIAGVIVRIYDAESEEVLDVTETDENGDYLLDGLKTGIYTVELDIDDEEAVAFDFERSAANLSENTELPGADEQWELRCVKMELNENRNIDFGFMIGMDMLLQTQYMLSSETVPAAASDGGVTTPQMVLNGRKVYWKNTDVTGQKIDSSIYIYRERYIDEYPNVRLFCLNRSAEAKGEHTKQSDIPASVMGDSDVRSYCKKVAYYSEHWPGWGDLKENEKKRYHLAAQMLIWDRIHGGQHRAFIANQKNTKIEREVDLSAEKNNIKAQVEKHNTKPFKVSDKIEPLLAIRDDVNKPKHVYKFEDPNGVLCGYEVTESDKGIANAVIKDNQLVVTMEDAAKYNNQTFEIKLKRKDCPGIENVCYVGADSTIQPLLMWGSVKVTATVKVTYVAKSSVAIGKVDDSGAPVAGVRFRWGYSKDAMTNLTGFTDANGWTSRFDALCESTGVIYVQEESVPADIEKSTEIKKLAIRPNQNDSVVFTNRRMRPVTLRKVDSETGKPIPNVIFKYYAADKPNIIYTGVTDDNGLFTSPAVFFAGQTIVMREEHSAVNYLLPIDETARTQRLTLSTDNSKNVFTFQNTPYKIRLKVTKYNSRTKEPVEGMVFRIGTDPNLSDADKYKEYETDKNGILTCDWIRRDQITDSKIYYQEVDGPANIKIDRTIRWKATPPDANDIVQNDTIEVTVYNEEEPVPIQVKKTGSDGKPLDGVSFNVQRYSNGGWKSVETIRTANGGYAVTKTKFERKDIAEGHIRLQETSLGTNKGYGKLDAPVIIPANLADVNAAVVEVSIENSKIQTELEIYKFDMDSKKPLSNAYFQITDANGNWVKTLQTGTDGKASTTDLYAYTPYYIEETTVPRGYEKYGIFTEKVWFMLTEDGKIVTAEGETETIGGKPYSYHFDVPNKPVYGYIEIYKTDTKGKALKGFEFTIYKNGVPMGTLITDKNGYAKSGKLLADSSYRVEETYCPPQYSALPNSVNRVPDIDFLNPASAGTEGKWSWSFNKSTLTMTYRIQNEEKLGKVKVRKVDSEDKTIPVRGATIRLVNYYTGVVIQSQVTGLDGWAYFDDVPLVNPTISSTQGYYYLEEITPGDNHVLPAGTENPRLYFALTVEDPDKEVEEEFEFANPPVRGIVQIKKVDKDNPSQVLSGAEFAVYEAEAYEAAIASGATPKAVATKETGTDGLVEFNLRYGRYIIKEAKASKCHFIDLENGGLLDTSSGVTYDKSVQGYRVTVSEHGKTIPFTVTNPKLKIQVEVTKYGYNQKVLPNVKFNICKSDGTVIGEIRTGADGKATSKTYIAEELGEGAYIIEAEKVPNYELNTTKYPISVISQNNTEVELRTIKVTNTREDIKLKLLKTNEEGEGVAATFRIDVYASTISGNEYYRDSFYRSTLQDNNVADLASILKTIDNEFAGNTSWKNNPVPARIEITEVATEQQYLRKDKIIARFNYSPQKDDNSRLSYSSSEYSESEVSYDKETLTLTVVNKPIPITLTLFKMGNDWNYLSGAEFSIQPNGIDADPIRIVTDGSSSGTKVNLPYATSYTVTELSAPDGYVNTYGSHTISLSEFTQTKDSNNNITAYNQVLSIYNYKGGIQIRKVGSDGKPLDAKFCVIIKDNSGTELRRTEVVTKEEDDGYGTVDLSALYEVSDNGSIIGPYTATLEITEISVDSDYTLMAEPITIRTQLYSNVIYLTGVGTSPEGVTVSTSEDSSQITVTVEDTRKPTYFYLKKKGLGSDNVTANIRMEAYQGTTGIKYYNDNITTTSKLYNFFFSSLTSADGYDIYITENSVTLGYKLLPRFKAFTYYPDKEGTEKFQDVDEHISIENSIGDTSNSFDISLINEPKTVKLWIKKIDADTQEPLTNAQISVTTSNGVTKTTTTKGAAEGELMELPYAASYTITEVKAPDGYEALTDSKTMLISEFNQKTVNGETVYEGEVTLENTRKYEFYINKEDSFGNSVEASFRIHVSGRGITNFNEYVDTKNGKADLTPVLEKAKEQGIPTTGYWTLALFETDAEEGLKPCNPTTAVASFNFYPGNIYAGSRNFIELTSAEYPTTGDIIYGTGAYVSAHFTVKNSNIPINLTVIKKEDGSSPEKYLAGAKFKIQPEGRKAIEVTTTGTAQGVTVQLPYAKTYIVSEESAPDGYIKDPAVYTYSIDDFEKTGSGANITAYNKSVTYTNAPIKGSIKISKYDAADPDNQAKMVLMEGAEFEIYKGTAPTTGTEEEKYNAVSTANGYTLADTVVIGEDGTGVSKLLSYGDYVIKEKKAPKDYDLSYELQEKSIRRKEEIVQAVYTDPRKEGSLTIYKWEKDTNKPLANTKFQVYDAETNEAVGEELITGVDGKTGAISLPYGSYYIREIDAPPGYITISGDWEAEFSIDENHQNVTRNVDNEKSSYALKLLKKSEEGDYLAGAVFGVFSDGTEPDNRPEATNAIRIFTTGSSGVAIEPLEEAGDYDIYELKAPDGYELITEKIADIHVDKDSPTAEVQVENHRQRINLRIIKVDEEDQTKRLSGAVFEIRKKATGVLVATTNPTNGNGEVTVEVPAGNIVYTVTEITAPGNPGEYVLDSEPKEIAVTSKEDSEGNVTFEAEPLMVTNRKSIKGTIKLIKTEENQPNIPVEGAVYGVYDSDNFKVAELKTKSNGEAQVSELEFGTYTVKEIQLPYGYGSGTISPDTVILSEDTPVITIYAEDPPLLSGFRIKKVDAFNASKTLSGAEFKVFANWDDAYAYDLNNPATGTEIMTAESTNTGIAVFDNLKYGTYYVRETKAPEGYAVSEEISEVTVDADSMGDAAMIVYEDYPATGTFLVKKTDRDTGTALAGAVFLVEEVSDAPDKYSKEYTTGENGTFETDDLIFGSYQVTEIKAPDGYRLSNPVTQTVVLNKDSWKETITITFANERIQIPITIHKMDDADKPLAGARFAIYAADGKGNPEGAAIDNLVTGLDGNATSTMLPIGKYVLVEESAPDGYEIIAGSDSDYFEIDENTQSEIVKTVRNTPITGKLRIEKKDADTKKGMNGVEFSVYCIDGSLYDTITTETVDGVDGIAILDGVPYGIYYVKETTPKGYVDGDYQEIFRIGSESEEREILLEVENTPIKGSFGLIKVDADNPNVVVPGAVYGIYTELREDGSVEEDSYLGQDYNLVTLPDIEVPESTVPDTGEVIPAYFEHQWAESKELLYGTYYIKELASPDDYKLNDKIYTVDIKENQTYVEVIAEDTKYIGSVSVHKVDQHANAVEGAVFAVYTKENYERIDTEINVPAQYITTDSTGTAVLDGLSLHQTYVIIEDMAPAGYEKDSGFYHEFTPEKNQLTFEFTCTNRKIDEIIVRKVDDRGNPLVLAIFGLYSSGPDGVPQTGDDRFIDNFGNANSLEGYARYNISGFQEGSYYVKELQKPGDQYILSSEIIEFTIAEERRSFEFDFVNKPYEARLQIKKLDENNQPLTGAEFELYELDYTWNEEILEFEASETLIRTISMRSSAETLITDLRADSTYLLRETKAPDGYARVGDIELNFNENGELTTDIQGDTFYYCAVDIVNKPAKGKIQIQKVVENTTGVQAEYSLEGAEFKITDSSDQQVGEVLVTGRDGMVASEELPYGVYRIAEIKAPDGTVLNEEIGTVNIDGTQADGIYEYTHTNPIPTGKILILKKDEKGALLDGAEFEVLREGIVVDELTTVNGHAESKELPYGTYIIHETKAPVGHKLGEVTEWTREIDASVSTVEIEVMNPSGEGQGIHIVKYDKDSPNIYLQGAVFDLYTEENWNGDSENRQPLERGLITDEKGYLDVILEPGSYVLIETEAPHPYVTDDTPYSFTLGKDQFISLYIPNETPKGRIMFTKTGDLLAGIEDDTSYQNLKRLLWEDGNVEGAEIGIYTTEEVSWSGKTYETGALICTLKSGEVSDYLPLGIYEYREVSAPSAYIPDTERHSITVTAETVTASEPVEANLVNRHALAELELYKTFSNLESLSDAQVKAYYSKVRFGVYTKEEIKGSGVILPINTLVAVFGVDENGKSNFTSQKLPEGAYYVRELETAEGYLLDTEEYSFLLKYNNENVKIQLSTAQEPIINKPLYGMIQIVKVGPTFTGIQSVAGPENRWTVNLPVYTEEEIFGGVFEIHTTNAVEIDGDTYEAGAVVDTINGGETSRELPLGDYTVTEVSAPDGYIQSDQTYAVGLTADADIQEVIVKEARIFNDKARIQLQVYKNFFGLSNEEAKDLYPKVYFGVFAAEEIGGVGYSAVLKKDMLVNLIQIGEDGTGMLEACLPAGNYYIKELATAEGYELSEEKYYFTVEADSQGTIEIEGTGERNKVINYPIGGVSFAFRKIDERNKPLAGAFFKLYWCKNEEEGHIHSELADVADSCWIEIGEGLSKSSREDGIVDFGKLPDGDYQLKEIEAPEGYELPKGQWRIHVISEAGNQIKIEACGDNTPPAFKKADGADTYQYQLPNYKRKDLPVAGGFGVFPYMGGGSVFLSAALLLKKRRKEESEE